MNWQRLKFDFTPTDTSPITALVDQVAEAEYGCFVWPSAIHLAAFLVQNPLIVRGKCVLEVGAGTSLPGIVSSCLGAQRVLLSDAKHVLPVLRRNAKINRDAGCDAEVVGLEWGIFDDSTASILSLVDRIRAVTVVAAERELMATGTVDVILGSDVFYDKQDFEKLVVTVAYIIDEFPEAVFITAYQPRSTGRTMDALLERYNLSGSYIPTPPDMLDRVSCDKTLPQSYSVELYLVRRKTATTL